MTTDEAQADMEHNMNILREMATVKGRDTAVSETSTMISGFAAGVVLFC